MPAFGGGGPYADFVGVGPIMEMMSGMASVVGYGDGRPVTTGPAYLDPMGGMNGAAAVVTALAARETTGEGQHIELAQREAAMHWYGEVIVHDIGTGTNTLPCGNRADFAVPHDAFPALGEDQWVAIAAHTDDEFAAMCRVMQLIDLAARADLETLDGRLEREDEIFDRVRAWTRTRDKHETARQLQEAGVHAAAVFTGKDLSESRFLAERHLLVELAHSDAGKHVYQGVPLHLDKVDFTGWRASPCFGEHTDEILRDWLGYEQQQVEDIRATGCIEDVPRGLASPS
jgi:crotonobetainyl-CoA:carnitine CoA-transferase CaiB-like acyl-CoA transferase